VQRLKSEAKAYRIGSIDNTFPIWSGIGPSLYPQRWNARGQQAIYAAEHFATAMLEVLARQSRPSAKQRYIEITLPKGLSYSPANVSKIRDWKSVGSRKARALGAEWIEKGHTAILYVPSVIAHQERNIVINPQHNEFKKIKISEEMSVNWDGRLFKSG